MKGKIWLGVAGVIGLIFLALAALPFLVSADRFRPVVQSQLADVLARQVTIGHLDFSILRGDLRADDIAISDDVAFSRSPFVHAKSLDVGVELIPLIFSRAIHIRSVTLREPDVVLLRSSSGKWNFSSIGAKEKKTKSTANSKAGSSPDLTMQKLTVADGRIRFGTVGRKQLETYEDVNLTMENVSYRSSFPFSLEARTPGKGSLQIEGTAGPLNQRDAAQTPFQATVNLKQMDLASTGFLDPSSGIAGIVNYQGKVGSDGRTARTEGTTQIDRMRVVQAGTPAAQPVSVEYSSDYSFARQSGELTRGQLRTGKSAIAVSGAYDASGNSTVVHMKLDAPGVPLADIQALLPAFGVTLPAGSSLQGGTVKTNLSVDGPLDGLITTGELTMSDAKLAGFGLGSKLGALATFSGLKATPDTLIQVLSSNLRITPDGIALDSLNLVVPDLGTITGGGTIGQSQALNFKMRARLAEGGGIAGIASRSGLGGALGRDIPFLVQGTSSKPIILPDAAGMVKAGVSNLGQSIGTEQPKSVGDLINGIFGQQKKQ